MKYLKKTLKVGTLLCVIGVIVLNFLDYNNTKYSYLDVFRLKGSSIIRSQVYAGEDPLRTDGKGSFSELKVQSLELLYKKKTTKYFKELWAGYEKGSNSITYTKEGIAYYKKNRVWKKAKLVSGSDTLKVNIRAHGIEPDGHHIGNFFSYQVKIRKGKKFKGKSKFKLIIYERLGFQVNLLSFYQKKYDLLWAKPEELVKLNINKTGGKLFYVEDYGVAKPKGLSDMKRLVINGYKSGAEVLGEPTDWVKKAIEISENDSIEKLDLLSMNQILLSRDSIKVHDFFDEDYLIRYLVLKTILGYSGHECYPGNWYMYYNKANRKFYPALSREPNLMTLNDEMSLIKNISFYNHPVEDRSDLRLNLYSILFSNAKFYNKYISALKTTILNDKDELIKEWWAAKAYHENLVKGSSVLSILKVEMKLKDIENNIQILENLLSERERR
jgi:hypothetical protein